MATKTRTKFASPRAVQGIVDSLNDAFLQCRDLGHNWRIARINQVRGGHERRVYCPTCKTNKTQFIDSRGTVTADPYSYPKGYQITGLGRINARGKAVLRLESLDRAAKDGKVHIIQEESEVA